MEAREEQLTHLERLAQALDPYALTAELVSTHSRPYVLVANAGTPTLNERVYCGQAADRSWEFRWPGRQPIGPVDDLDTAAGKITEVLRPVGGQT